ncbi:MAG: UbiA family prenyltransferase [Polyangiales bacterium]
MSDSSSLDRSERIDLGTVLKGHLAIMRVDHWFKHVFAIPGLAVAFYFYPDKLSAFSWLKLVLGTMALCTVASSYYTLNEALDAATDRHHPEKCKRPVAAGIVKPAGAYLQWLLLFAISTAIAFLVSAPFAWSCIALWLMGCLYNIRPIRTKDLPYLDVISESVNNPLRFLAGWFIADANFLPPLSLLLSYWMVGAFFMNLKRYAEYRHIGDPSRAAAYRKSFAHYTEERLLSATVFYASAAMLFLGAFIVRYKFELILSVPFLAAVMSSYFHLAQRKNSDVQNPEKLYRNPALLGYVALCALVMLGCLSVELPELRAWFEPQGAIP